MQAGQTDALEQKVGALKEALQAPRLFALGVSSRGIPRCSGGVEVLVGRLASPQLATYSEKGFSRHALVFFRFAKGAFETSLTP